MRCTLPWDPSSYTFAASCSAKAKFEVSAIRSALSKGDMSVIVESVENKKYTDLKELAADIRQLRADFIAFPEIVMDAKWMLSVALIQNAESLVPAIQTYMTEDAKAI